MTQQVFIITDYDYCGNNHNVTSSVHYCVEIETDGSESNDNLFDIAVKEIKSCNEDFEKEKIVDWWVE